MRFPGRASSAPLTGHARHRPASQPRPSAERECESLYARAEELDVEGSIRYAIALSDQLVEPVRRDGALPLAVDVGAVIVARCLAIDQNTKPHWLSGLGGAENEVQIAGVKSVDNMTARAIENGSLALNSPVALQSPLIELRR